MIDAVWRQTWTVPKVKGCTLDQQVAERVLQEDRCHSSPVSVPLPGTCAVTRRRPTADRPTDRLRQLAVRDLVFDPGLVPVRSSAHDVQVCRMCWVVYWSASATQLFLGGHHFALVARSSSPHSRALPTAYLWSPHPPRPIVLIRTNFNPTTTVRMNHASWCRRRSDDEASSSDPSPTATEDLGVWW